MTRTVLITGTSSGYGKAMADLFHRRGWNVVATMRRPDPEVFAAASHRLPSHRLPSDRLPSDRLVVLPLDVTDSKSIENALEEAAAAFGAIDVLVNNAGIGLASIVEATPDRVVHEIFETNTFGVFATCRAVIPRMRARGCGTIINVTSSAGIGPMPLSAVYTASKCAVEGFTEALSYELEPFGIKARLIEPGYAPTTNFSANAGPRLQGLIPDDYGAFAQSYFQKLASYPTAYCTEAEVAEAALAAATDQSDKLRYPAGADSKLLAELRWTTSEDHYLARMRDMFAPAPAGRRH